MALEWKEIFAIMFLESVSSAGRGSNTQLSSNILPGFFVCALQRGNILLTDKKIKEVAEYFPRVKMYTDNKQIYYMQTDDAICLKY